MTDHCCPMCGKYININGCFDGANYKCEICNLKIVTKAYTDGSWRLRAKSFIIQGMIDERDYLNQRLRARLAETS